MKKVFHSLNDYFNMLGVSKNNIPRLTLRNSTINKATVESYIRKDKYTQHKEQAIPHKCSTH